MLISSVIVQRYKTEQTPEDEEMLSSDPKHTVRSTAGIMQEK